MKEEELDLIDWCEIYEGDCAFCPFNGDCEIQEVSSEEWEPFDGWIDPMDEVYAVKVC